MTKTTTVIIRKLEQHVYYTTPKEFYRETMEEIVRELNNRYLKKKEFCPALDEMRQLKLF